MTDSGSHPRQPTPGDTGPAASDGQRPGRADEAHHRVLTARRRSRCIAALLTPALLATLIVGCSAAGARRDAASPPSSATPGPPPASGLVTLAAHPLLTVEEGFPVKPGAARASLSPCVSNPLTWGAAESDAAAYGRPGGRRFGNEFVLRFDTVAAAHSAVTDAWRVFQDCPTPRKVEAFRGGLPLWGPRLH